MSGDISHVSPESSPTLTDLSTDLASTSAALPKLYHITEPWEDHSAPPSEHATPRSAVTANEEHSTLPETVEVAEQKEDVEPEEQVSPSFSQVTVSSSQPDTEVGREEGLQSPDAGSIQSESSSVDKIIREANLLVSEMHKKDNVDQMESSNNTTYRDLPGATVAPDQEHGDPSTTLADREVEILNADSVASKNSSAKQTPRRTVDEHKMDADPTDKVKSLMSDTGWRDRRIKSFDYAALKQDLEDIESRLQRARESTNAASMWPDQRKAQSLQFLMGAPHSPIERNQSPDTLTSSGKASSLAELDRSRRLKWDYAADIASGRDPATPVAGLGGSGELSGSGDVRMRMSMSQASFVSSPDPEDSAVEAAIKSRDLAVLKESKGTGGNLSSRMEDILGHEDPQSHVAAILQQADEAERRLRARLRKAPEDCGSGASYYGDGAWNRLNLGTGMPSSTTGRLGASGGMTGNTDSARSNTTTSGEQVSGSGRLGASARSNTTMESTHPGSDDAMGPAFPDGAYGSRADPHYSPRGIYYKPKTKDGKVGPQFKAPAMPQRSRTGPRAIAEEPGHHTRPPVSPSAGFGDVHKSLETISSHDTGASTTVAARTSDLEGNSLEEYATKLRSKWERYQRLLGQDRGDADRPTTPREIQDLLRNPSRYAKSSAALKKTPREAWAAEPVPKQKAHGSARSGERRRSSGSRGEKLGSGGSGRSRGVQAGKGRPQWGPAGDGGSDDEGNDRWRRRGGYEELRVDSEPEDTDSQDTINLMTRMAGLLRNNYEDDEVERAPSPSFTEEDQISEGTCSELDPQLLRLKHLFLKQKEKWLWERARETTRRHKIQKLQQLIAERVRRHRVVNIEESLDTATLSSSILSDLEDTTAQGSPGGRGGSSPARQHHRRQSSAPSQSSDGTLTESTPVLAPRRGERRGKSPQKSPQRRSAGKTRAAEGSTTRTKPPIIKMKKNRQVQVYPPGQTWEIPAPKRWGASNKENWRPNMPVRRAKPSPAFMDKLTEVSSRDHKGLAAAGGGLSWYHPVADACASSRATEDDSLSLPMPGTSRSGRHAEVGVQGDSEAPSLSVPSDGVHLQVKLAQPLLTEAFEGRMAAFISRSRERQKRVRLAAEERRYVAQMEAERVKLFVGDEKGARRRRPRTQPDPLSENLHQPQRRAFTRKEMREQNRRMCRALPETQQRALDEKKKAQTRSNIIRRQLYGEKVLRSVLRKRGPWVVTF